MELFPGELRARSILLAFITFVIPFIATSAVNSNLTLETYWAGAVPLDPEIEIIGEDEEEDPDEVIEIDNDSPPGFDPSWPGGDPFEKHHNKTSFSLDKPWITVYDVDGSYSKKNITSKGFSNTEIQGCERIESAYGTVNQSNIQLIKMLQYPHIRMTQCTIIISILNTNCDGWTYPSDVSKFKEVQRVNRVVCDKWKNGGTADLTLRPVKGGRKVKIKNVVGKSHFVVKRHRIIGVNRGNGKCFNEEHWDGVDNAIVVAELTTRRREIFGRYLPKKKSILVEGGELPLDLYKNGSIHSDVLGTFHFDWDDLPKNKCDHLRTVIAGEGMIYQPNNGSKVAPIASIIAPAGKPLVTVVMEEEIPMCGGTLFSTNLDGFYISLYNDTHGIIPTENLTDIKEYEIDKMDVLHNKINTLVLNLGLALQADFATTVQALCETKQLSALNYLSLLGHKYGRAPGRVGNETAGIEVLNYGSVTYLVQGAPVSAQVRSHDYCCEEIPILLPGRGKNNTELYADPRSKIIRPYCTKRVCDEAFPYYYFVSTRNVSKNSSEEFENKYLCTTGTPEIVECPIQPMKIEIMSAPLESQLDDFANLQPKLHSDEAMQKHHLNQLLYGASKSINADIAHSFVKDLPEAYVAGRDQDLVKNWYRNDIREDITGRLESLLPSRIWEVIGTAMAVLLTSGVCAFGLLKKIAPIMPWGEAFNLLGMCCSQRSRTPPPPLDSDPDSDQDELYLQPARPSVRKPLSSQKGMYVEDECVREFEFLDGTIVREITPLMPAETSEETHSTTIVAAGDQHINCTFVARTPSELMRSVQKEAEDSGFSSRNGTESEETFDAHQ